MDDGVTSVLARPRGRHNAELQRYALLRRFDSWVVSEMYVDKKTASGCFFAKARLILKPCHSEKNSRPRKTCFPKPISSCPPRNSQRTAPPDAVSHSAPLSPLPMIFSPSPSRQWRLSPLGARRGSVVAKRGSDYFRKLAARRKTHGDGRPRKESELSRFLQSHFLLHCFCCPGGIFLPFVKICSARLATASKAQFTRQAKTCNTAIEASATNTTVSAYSTSPWPSSSLSNDGRCAFSTLRR